MNKLWWIIGVLVVGGWLLIVRHESATVVSIPTVPTSVQKKSEAEVVEAYIRESDISTLTSTESVLGGSWHFTEVLVNTSSDTATISYEDGHIAEKGMLTYTYDQATQTVSVNGFTKDK